MSEHVCFTTRAILVYAVSVAPHWAAGGRSPNPGALKRSPMALFLRPLFYGGCHEGTLGCAVLQDGTANLVALRHQSLRFAAAGGGSQLLETITMSNVTPLRPGNSTRTQDLLNTVSAPSAPVDINALTHELPDIIGYALDLILDDFDYDANRRAPTAVAIRILATLADRYQEARS